MSFRRIVSCGAARTFRRVEVAPEPRQHILLSFKLDDGAAHFELTVEQASALRDDIAKQISDTRELVSGPINNTMSGAGSIPPDWKQDQAETSRLPRKPLSDTHQPEPK